MNLSHVARRGRVTFPEFTGERVYMVPFFKHIGLPSALRRWQPTVDQMLNGVETKGPVYFMADQSEVLGGRTQRRPGVHIDGYWNPAINAHGGGHSARHRPAPPGQSPFHDARGPLHSAGNGGWDNPDFSYPEAILLASDAVPGRAYIGEYGENPADGGDCSHVDLYGLGVVDMDPNWVWAGNVSFLHKSSVAVQNTNRTLVRLNVPGWCPTQH